MEPLMRRVLIAGLLGLLAALPVSTVSAQGLSPAQLQRAGWDCFQPPPDFNPYIHCAPPGQLAGIISGEAATGMFLAFATTDLNATDAALLGTERMIRGDLFHGQPCPTDPPSFEYSWLFPRFGWDYYICHTFDSPW
ncbi:MAG: hypothetical protein QOJ75_1751 [Chloroflexota bacterium]|jgi:hypothetical protein|nr:hypothetical protein [Chloroflexota bacterium]